MATGCAVALISAGTGTLVVLLLPMLLGGRSVVFIMCPLGPRTPLTPDHHPLPLSCTYDPDCHSLLWDTYAYHENKTLQGCVFSVEHW
jgi:hypothetical protein